MYVRLALILVVMAVVENCESIRGKRRIISFRKMAKIFVRYNVKVNVVPYTGIFAYAMGFRGNWDVQPQHLLPADRSSFYPVNHQRYLHDSMKSFFDWHGLDGTACLIRATCEAKMNHGDDIISKAFRLMFHSDEGFRCPDTIDCPFSLLHLIDNTIDS